MIDRAVDFATLICDIIRGTSERPPIVVSYSEHPKPRTDAIVIRAGAVYAYGTNYDVHIAKAIYEFYRKPFDLELQYFELDERLINECLRAV